MAPRWPQDSPRWPQEGPKMAQDGPKMAQDGPKKALRRPKQTPRWPKLAQDGPVLSPKLAQYGRSAPICSVYTMYMQFKQATGRQQQTHTRMAMACNNTFCTVNQAKAKLTPICIYTSCHVKVPTAAVSARSALGFQNVFT